MEIIWRRLKKLNIELIPQDRTRVGPTAGCPAKWKQVSRAQEMPGRLQRLPGTQERGQSGPEHKSFPEQGPGDEKAVRTDGAGPFTETARGSQATPTDEGTAAAERVRGRGSPGTAGLGSIMAPTMLPRHGQSQENARDTARRVPIDIADSRWTLTRCANCISEGHCVHRDGGAARSPVGSASASQV